MCVCVYFYVYVQYLAQFLSVVFARIVSGPMSTSIV